MRSHSCHLVLLWNILASLATAQQEAGPAGDFIPLCRDSQGLGGQLSIAPSPAFVLAIPEKPHSTIFVKEFPSYSFKCSSGDANDEVFLSFRQKSRYPSRRRRVGPPLGWRSNSSSDQGVIVDEIQRSQLVVKDWLNGNNVTVTCATNETTFCGINLILMKESHSDEFCDTFHVKEITDKTPAPLTCNVTELSKGKGTKGSSFPTIISQRGQNFEPVVKFSIYSPELGEWVPCKKLDLPGNSTESSSSPKPMIECPVNRTEGQSHETKATVIRIEKIQNTLVGVALPVLGPPQKKSYSYFTVDVKFAAPLVRPQSEMNAEDEKDDNQIAMIVSGTIVGLTIVGLLILVAVLLHGRKNGICRVVPNRSHSDLDVKGDASVVTELTSVNGRSEGPGNSYLTDIFFEDSPGYQDLLKMDKGTFKKILERQLSGNPSKLNPELSLNQQVNILSYDPKLEIRRNMFTMGSVLGTGHFGSVYEGEAIGLIYPQSKTRVAIKTVNNALDLSQLQALLCEMKIMTNLDLHMNLVNLLGSCTAEIESRNLWLLIEYCPHGDLKTFLINHRQQFNNNIQGLIATDLDIRMCLLWSHSIAKGMEYLSSKRIMHGDLAARNILISDNYVAKISDFGLSKSMYDNTQYKKQRRNYVPWKWMALEYLTDGHFTLKSDVWSYGIVLWEMFSLGQEPYLSKDTQETVKAIKHGYRLDLPSEVTEIPWANDVFDKVMKPSWHSSPDSRISFSSIVRILELLMDSEETLEYQKLAEEYAEMAKLLLFNESRKSGQQSSQDILRSPSSLPPSYSRVQSVTEGNREDPTTMERDKKIKMQSPSKDSSIPNGYSTMESLNHNGYTSIDHLKEPQQSSLVQGPSPLPPPQHLNGYTSSLNAMIQTKPPEPDSYFQSQDGGFGSGYSKHFSQLKMSESDCCVSVEQVKKKNNNNAMSFVVQKDRQQQQLLCQPGNGGEGVL